MPRLSSEKFYETLNNLSGTDKFNQRKIREKKSKG